MDVSYMRKSDETYNRKQHAAGKEKRTSLFSRLEAVDELGSVLHDTLQLKDESSSGDSDLSSDDYDINLETSGKCLQKCATFPAAESETQSYNRSLSLPSTHNLISAMKGTREGLPPKKLKVSWAPDVYDPTPTTLSRYPVKKNQQQYNKTNKKHGKGKQKGKMQGAGSGPKEKKHYQKMGGKAARCLDSCADTDRVMS